MAIERQKLIHLHTPEVKTPAVGLLEAGEIAVQHNAEEAALYIEKSNGVIAKFIDEVAVEAKIAVEKARAEGIEEGLFEKIEALEGSNHTHENKDILDGITAENIAAWNAAEANAIADAESKYQVKGEYEAAGAAAQALVDAKADAAEKYQVKGEYEVAGAAAAVEGKLDAHKEDAVMHVTAQERTDWNAAKSAIDAFLKDADMTEKAVDTLAELQTYMTTDGEAAAKLIDRVSALEEIDHNAYVSADTQVLADAKAYVDGKVDGKFDAVGSAAAAEAAAKAEAAEKYQVKGEYEAAGAAAQALADAKADAAEKYQVKGEYEVAGAAAQALADAKADAESKYQPKGNYEVEGTAAQALADAKADAEAKYQVKGNYEVEGAAAQALADAKADAASLYQPKGEYEAAGAAAQALADAKADAAEKYQVKGEYEAAGAAAAAEAAAKTYTDNAISALRIDCGTY